MKSIAVAVVSALVLCAVPSDSGAQASGKYLAVATDQLITSTRTLLSGTLSPTTSSKVFVESDGRVYPNNPNALANMYITIDGVRVSNHSVLQWFGSAVPEQHSYNAIGATTLSAGTHTVALVAAFSSGEYSVGAGSNLSMMLKPAAQAFYQQTSADSSLINYTTVNLTDGIKDYNALPRRTILSQAVASSGADIIALASGRSYVPMPVNGKMGDAMWGLFFDGSFIGFDPVLGSTASSWSVNDLFTFAELQAPMYVHAFFKAPTAVTHTISLGATEFPWGHTDPNGVNCGKGFNEDCVEYQVGLGSSLVVLTGSMTVRGSASPLCPSGCGDQVLFPPATDFLLAQKTITIPSSHPGTVMFVAKARVQPHDQDPDATYRLWITIDGVLKGSTGVQHVQHSVSQRTLSASYLAAAPQNLSVGNHIIRVFVRGDGTFVQTPWVHHEIPLVWFD